VATDTDAVHSWDRAIQALANSEGWRERKKSLRQIKIRPLWSRNSIFSTMTSKKNKPVKSYEKSKYAKKSICKLFHFLHFGKLHK